jgi:hypothetical protein
LSELIYFGGYGTGVVEDDANAMVAALAEPVALLVFGVIVAATSKARVVDEFGLPPSGTRYVTPFGLAKRTSLPREVVQQAAERLVYAGLLEVLADDGRGCDNWRVNEARIAAVAARSVGAG